MTRETYKLYLPSPGNIIDAGEMLWREYEPKFGTPLGWTPRRYQIGDESWRFVVFDGVPTGQMAGPALCAIDPGKDKPLDSVVTEFDVTILDGLPLSIRKALDIVNSRSRKDSI